MSVLVARESFELGVDNPNINQVVHIECPGKLGILLQEVGRAGRQKDSTANDLLLFNECINDKQLDLWLKSALDCSDASSKLEQVKNEMLTNYVSHGVLYMLFIMGNACHGHYHTSMLMIKIFQLVL